MSIRSWPEKIRMNLAYAAVPRRGPTCASSRATLVVMCAGRAPPTSAAPSAHRPLGYSRVGFEQ